MFSELPYAMKELLQQVGVGSETAYRQVFDHYKIPFYNAAFKMTRSGEAAEEIVQEVFIILWKKREQIGTAENPEGYLMRILYNSIYAHFRRLLSERQLKRKLVELDVDAFENPVDELIFEKENQNLVNDIISRLPYQQQIIYRLSKLDGLSRDEIAQKLNLSPNTVRNHLATAVKSVREYARRNASILIWLAILKSF